MQLGALGCVRGVSSVLSLLRVALGGPHEVEHGGRENGPQVPRGRPHSASFGRESAQSTPFDVTEPDWGVPSGSGPAAGRWAPDPARHIKKRRLHRFFQIRALCRRIRGDIRATPPPDSGAVFPTLVFGLTRPPIEPSPSLRTNEGVGGDIVCAMWRLRRVGQTDFEWLQQRRGGC